MKPIAFPEQTMVLAKNQPPFKPLPVYQDERETISCWRLGWFERLRVLWTGVLWLRQINYGQSLQAQAPTTRRPFIVHPTFGGEVRA